MDRCPKRNPGWRLKDMAAVWLGDRMILERAGEHGGNARWRWRCICGHVGADRGDRLRAKGEWRCNQSRCARQRVAAIWAFWRRR